ncbi:transposase [Marinicellulosiphila megalodicopiae]|uniref:transposase n=1 Tax=Marinicellulosiphila megalodicopiae TaxID=2724896 RepID=UPI003BB0E472
MPRAPRVNLPDIAQHVVQRGNNKQACFFSEEDYVLYLSKAKEYALKFEVDIHSYVLMTNHVHFLLTPRKNNGVSLFMQALGRFYVQYINRTYERTGTLWEGRYRSTIVGTDAYFLQVSRYIEMNPVRAKMVLKASDYKWSSYQHNALDKNIELITPHACYMALGKTDEERKFCYCQFVNKAIPEKLLTQIRDSTKKSWALGDKDFIFKIEEKLNRRLSAVHDYQQAHNH